MAKLDTFLKSALLLKGVKRAGWQTKVKITNPESVADHTFSMCIIGMVISDIARLDGCRVMKMVMLHDLAESITGDFVPGKVSRQKKIRLERRAMGLILQNLPARIRSEYKNIWNEYTANKTGIAQFVHKLDKLEMALQASEYKRQGYPVSLLSEFVNSAKKIIYDERRIMTAKPGKVTGDKKNENKDDDEDEIENKMTTTLSSDHKDNAKATKASMKAQSKRKQRSTLANQSTATPNTATTRAAESMLASILKDLMSEHYC